MAQKLAPSHQASTPLLTTLHLLAPALTWGFELSRLNQRIEAQAIESWFMLEIITTGRVSVWGEERNHRGGCVDSSCRHLVGARNNTSP